MAAFPCLNIWQPILGCDGHKLPPIPPSPVGPFIPHYVVDIVGGPYASSNICDTVKAGWGAAVTRGHDAGPIVPHIAPNPLLPLIILFGGSKAEFASGTVNAKARGGVGKVCVGSLWAVNNQLQCWDLPFPPMPTAVAITGLNTVRAGFTWADFFAGWASMLVDMVIQWALNVAVAGFTRGMSGALSNLLKGPGVRGMLGAFGRGFGRSLTGTFRFAGNAAGQRGVSRFFSAAFGSIANNTGTVIAILNPLTVGSPVGWSAPWVLNNQATVRYPGTTDNLSPSDYVNRWVSGH